MVNIGDSFRKCESINLYKAVFIQRLILIIIYRFKMT